MCSDDEFRAVLDYLADPDAEPEYILAWGEDALLAKAMRVIVEVESEVRTSAGVRAAGVRGG